MSDILYDSSGNALDVGGGGGGSSAPSINFKAANTVARAKQLYKLKYTPVRTLPVRSGDFAAGYEKTGTPYSHALVNDKLIGINISIHTFMTALHNPKSVLYTRTLENIGTNAAKTYYGSICSSFTAYALGMTGWLRCSSILTSDEFEAHDYIDVAVGDLVVSTGHAELVTSVTQDERGFIKSIELVDQYNPLPKVKLKGYDDFVYYCNKNGYHVRRYKHSDADALYVPSKYVRQMNEPATPIVYSDLCTNFGEDCTIKVGESIELNPLVTEGYTAIHLFKDGTQINTYSVEDTELTGLTAGKYTAKLYPYNNNAVVNFIVAECTATLNGNRITFSGANKCSPKYAELVAASYDVEKVIKLTTADISNGYVDLGDIAASYNIIKLFCDNEYGEIAYTMTRSLNQ